MEVFFETATIFCTVTGNEISPKTGQLKRATHEVALTATLYDQIGANRTQITIPETVNKKFQAINIFDYQTIAANNVSFKHIAFLLVYREKPSLKVTKLTSQPRTITIGNDEYHCVELFVTIVPSDNTVILDRRANLGPIAHFVKLQLQSILTPNQFHLATAQSLLEGTKVAIHQSLKKNYRDVLKTNFKHMKKISLTLAKPVSVQKKKRLNKQEDKVGLDLIKDTVKNVLGMSRAKSKFLDLPIKNFQFTLTLDEGVDLGEIKKETKNNLLSYIENDLITASAVEFDETSDIKKAVLAGLRVTEKIEMTATETEDRNIMWQKQRELYLQQTGNV